MTSICKLYSNKLIQVFTKKYTGMFNHVIIRLCANLGIKLKENTS